VNRADGTFLIISVPAELAEVKRENVELRRKLRELEIELRNALQHVLLMQFYQQSTRRARPNMLDLPSSSANRGASLEAAEAAAG